MLKSIRCCFLAFWGCTLVTAIIICRSLLHGLLHQMAGPISLIIFFLVPLLNCQNDPKETLANFGEEQFSQAERQYLIYDVNHGEGFNLRRDVYMRVANSVRQLRQQGHNYVLVLPPWGPLHHWRHQETRLRWAELFDVESLSQFVPVVEFEDFLQVNGNKLDLVLYLQPYAEGWSESEGYTLKYDKRACIDAYHYYAIVADAKWKAYFFSYEQVYASEFVCLSIQGQSSTLTDAILKDFSKPISLFVDRAETILHDKFGDVLYWRARRSMRYAKKLVQIGDQFRLGHFNSTDQTDQTLLAENWEAGDQNLNQATGGSYMCVHWRRADFVRSHRQHIPSIESTAQQIVKQMSVLGLEHVFLSTDADSKEVDVLVEQLNVIQPTIYVHRFLDDQLSDAAVSIVDQWVCAHARHFIGTHLSTFSFRIHEDREILGFPPSTTFNRLCSDEEEAAKEKQADANCEQPAKWTIVY